MGGEKFHAGPTSAMALIILLLLLLLPSTAHAGTYDVYACRLPDGSPAPTRSWTPVEAYAGRGAHGSTSDTCATGGVLSAELPLSSSLASAGSGAGWRFDAPSGTAISAFQIRRYARSSYLAVGAGSAGYVATLDAAAPGFMDLA